MIYCKNEFCVYNRDKKCIFDETFLDSSGRCVLSIEIGAEHFTEQLEEIKQEFLDNPPNIAEQLKNNENIARDYHSTKMSQTLKEQIDKKKTRS